MTDHASSSTTSSSTALFNLHVNYELKDLPDGILHKVFGYLGVRDLCRASAVCKRWRKLNSDKASQKRWCQFYSKRWPIEKTKHFIHQQSIEYMDWRKMYKLNYR